MSKNTAADESEMKSVLSDLLRHSDLKIDIGLRACRLLNGQGKYDACEFGLKELLSRFAGSRHMGRVHAERLHAAVQRLPVSDAIDYTDKFLDDNEVMKSFDDDVLKNMHLLLWEQAAKCHDTNQWLFCLSWYDMSHRLFMYGRSIADVKLDRETSLNVAKLLRNRVNCLVNLGRITEAEDVARRSLEFDSDSLLSYFSLFKVLVNVGKQQDAIDCVSSLAKSPGHVTAIAGKKCDVKHALICMAAQHALERNQREVAMATLRHLATSGRNDKATLTAYRCLIRLYLTICDGMDVTSTKPQSAEVTLSEPSGDSAEPMEADLQPTSSALSIMQSAIDCVKEAHQVLINLKKDNKLITSHESLEDKIALPGDDNHVMTEEEFSHEVTWFMKITWNIALQFNDNPTKMKELFLLCKEILALAQVDQSILLRQKTCLLMCAACALSNARNSTGQAQTDELNDVLSIIQQCRDICRDLPDCQNDFASQKGDKSLLLLKLYHFEALSKLTVRKDAQKLEDLFHEIAQTPQADAKTFETVAALSMELPAHHPGICKLSLKTALKYINIYFENDMKDEERTQFIKKRSALYRSLIDTSLNDGSATDPLSKDGCWSYVNEVYQLVQHEKNSIPELDGLWFTVRSWNVGVRLFSGGHVIEAEKWCALSLRLLAQLDRFKESYEAHMNHSYREILAKKDIMKSKVAMAF